MSDIAKKLHVSINTVSYWMDKAHLERRSIRDAAYKKHNPHGDPFQMNLRLGHYDQFLIGLGLGLFWGEGMKNSKSGVRLGNTDPFLILYFREFLERICRVKREKIKYSLQLFGDVDKKEAVNFWCDVLGIKAHELGKISEVKLRGRGTYKKKNILGVLQIACHNTKLKGIIDTLLRTLKMSSYAVVAQLVEHVHGETPKHLAQMIEN